MKNQKNEILKSIREKSGKTQKQVAQAANIEVRMYQDYEYGTGAKTIQTAIRIAKALDTTVEKLWNTNVV